MPFTWIPRIVAVGMLLFGLLFVVLGVRTLRADRLRRRTWHAARGQVVASRLDDEHTRCQVAYRRPDGTEVLFWNRYTSTVVRDPVGRAVQVLVNPADPHDAVVSSGLVGGSAVGVVFTAAGSVLAVVGLVVSRFVLL